jgi:hypothetical protein
MGPRIPIGARVLSVGDVGKQDIIDVIAMLRKGVEILELLEIPEILGIQVGIRETLGILIDNRVIKGDQTSKEDVVKQDQLPGAAAKP